MPIRRDYEDRTKSAKMLVRSARREVMISFDSGPFVVVVPAHQKKGRPKAPLELPVEDRTQGSSKPSLNAASTRTSTLIVAVLLRDWASLIVAGRATMPLGWLAGMARV